MAFLECYFDESGSHDGSPVLCLAGYLFEQDQCKAFDLGWKRVLDRFELPYFRMSACAHNQKPFDRLSRDQCIEVEKAMIALINEYALLGLAVVVNQADFDRWFDGEANPAGSSYSFCCWQILAGVRSWINGTGFEGKIAYFYESGHHSQSEANALMKRIFDNPGLRAGYRYSSHAFADKQALRPLQAADILAWQWGTQLKRWIRNDRRMRADFQALAAKPHHELFIGSRKTAGGMIAYHRSLQGLPIRDGITGHIGRTWFWCPFDGSPGVSI